MGADGRFLVRWGAGVGRPGMATVKARPLVAGSLIVALSASGAFGQPNPVAHAPDRVIHRFDFDEPDNFTPVPKYWVPFKTLPAFTVGRFDEAVGREAPPSFYLGLNGRDVAYTYIGPRLETPVRPDSDYGIVGWVKPDRLTTARAEITAFYVDADLLPMPETQVFSPPIGGGDDAWQKVELYLPAGPTQARSIGLTVRVVQERTWRTGAVSHRYIEPTAVVGGAWFDDIVIHCLPRAVIESGAAGNVFVRPATPSLEVLVTDSHPQGLTASVQLTDPAGGMVDVRTVPINTGKHRDATRLLYPDLDPGLYRATLEVRAGDEMLVRRHRTFACLSPPSRAGGAIARPFGVVLDGPGPPDDQLALLAALGVGSVKLPLWGASNAEPGFAETPELLDSLLHELVKSRVALVAVLAGPPHALVRSAGEFPRPLLEILNDDPEGWREHLAEVVAPFANIFRSWQVGRDDDPKGIQEDKLRPALAAVRREMKTLMTAPVLTALGNAHVDPGEQRLPAENMVVTVENDVHPPWIAEHLAAYQQQGYQQLGVYVEPLAREQYDRLAYLTDLAKRVLYTRHANADRVFLPQMWHFRPTVQGITSEPTEEFIVYRTLVDLLADANPDGELDLAPGVTCLAFDAGDRAVLALWDDSAPSVGREHVLPLGAASRQIDLWGRSTALPRTSDGRQIVRLSAVPVLIDGTEPWLVAFLGHLRMEPDHEEFRIGTHVHSIELRAPVREAVSGTLVLQAPESWDVTPRQFTFSLPPGGRLKKEVEIRYEHTEPAGEKSVVAQIDFENGPRYHIDVPLHFDVGLDGIDVWAFASMRGRRLVVRHGVLNRSDEVVDFRGFAAAPGRTRQYRVYNEMAPGRVRVYEYHFENATDLSGRTLRLGLREIGGTRGHNLEIAVP